MRHHSQKSHTAAPSEVPGILTKSQAPPLEVAGAIYRSRRRHPYETSAPPLEVVGAVVSLFGVEETLGVGVELGFPPRWRRLRLRLEVVAPALAVADRRFEPIEDVGARRRLGVDALEEGVVRVDRLRRGHIWEHDKNRADDARLKSSTATQCGTAFEKPIEHTQHNNEKPNEFCQHN